MRSFRSIALGAGASLVLVLSACGNGPPPDAGGGTTTGGGGTDAGVAIATGGTAVSTVKQTDDLKFDPATATAKVGDVIGFTNTGTTPHNVTFDAGPASPTMSGGDTALFKFSKAGSYHYVCTFHAPGMAGTITVQ